MASTSRVAGVLVESARLFNQGRYFEAHEVLEEALEDLPDDLWDLFIGLIQIAVGYHKVTQGLWSGAAGMLARGLSKVAPLPADAAELRLELLRQRVAADITNLRDGRFDHVAFARHPPRIQFVRPR